MTISTLGYIADGDGHAALTIDGATQPDDWRVTMTAADLASMMLGYQTRVLVIAHAAYDMGLEHGKSAALRSQATPTDATLRDAADSLAAIVTTLRAPVVKTVERVDGMIVSITSQPDVLP